MTDLVVIPQTNNTVVAQTSTPEPRSSTLGPIMKGSHPNRPRLNLSACDVPQDPTCAASNPSNDFRYKTTEQTLTPTFLSIMGQIRLRLERKVRDACWLGPLDFELKDFHVFLGEVSTSLLCAMDVWYRTVYQKTLYWEKMWREAYDEETPLTKQQVFMFFDQIRTGAASQRARWRDLFLHRNERLIAHVAKRYVDKVPIDLGERYWEDKQGRLHDGGESLYHAERQEARALLVQAGRVGLKKAVDKFKPELGFEFSTLAWHWIRGEMTALIKEEVAALNDPFHLKVDVRSEPANVLPCNPKMRVALEHAFERLNDTRTTQIITLRYGLFGNKRHSLSEVAGVVGITRQRVHVIEHKTLEQLRQDEELRQFYKRWFYIR
jgi:RNA polymerase sigma factor (sigma-70 family)